MKRRGAPYVAAVLGLALAAPGACTHDAWIGAQRRAGPDAGTDAHVPGGDARTDARPAACAPVECAGRIYACGDCIDNDRDGRVDMDDPECLGPCQSAEDTFANPLPGQGHGSCALDCYFDQDNGFGNDTCEWSHRCDPLSVAPDYPPEGMACAHDPSAKLPRGASCDAAQSDKCRQVCLPLTPNGCDCFGCCDIGAGPVFIGSVDEQGNPTCDLAHAADPTHCKPCTQVESCLNPCDNCEICVGKRTLPSSCGSSTACTPPECPPKSAPCGLDCLPRCAPGLSCTTGCCTEPPR